MLPLFSNSIHRSVVSQMRNVIYFMKNSQQSSKMCLKLSWTIVFFLAYHTTDCNKIFTPCKSL